MNGATPAAQNWCLALSTPDWGPFGVGYWPAFSSPRAITFGLQGPRLWEDSSDRTSPSRGKVAPGPRPLPAPCFSAWFRADPQGQSSAICKFASSGWLSVLPGWLGVQVTSAAPDFLLETPGPATLLKPPWAPWEQDGPWAVHLTSTLPAASPWSGTTWARGKTPLPPSAGLWRATAPCSSWTCATTRSATRAPRSWPWC